MILALTRKQDILGRLRAGVIAGEEKTVVELVQEALDAGVDPIEIVEQGLVPGIREVGERFDRMDIFLVDMMTSADAMKAGMNTVLTRIPKDKIPRRGTTVVGTVKGDIHEIGKNILSALLTAAGLEVHDLGCDVAASAFVKKAEEVSADIIAASALMTTTLPSQKDILDYLNFAQKRDKHLVFVGGGPTTASWGEEIGADAYAETAMDGVRLALESLAKKTKR